MLVIGMIASIRPTPRKICGHSSSPEVPVLGDPRHLPGADGEEQEAGHQHEARVDLRHQPAGDRRGHEHREAGDEHRLADHQRVVAADLRQIDRDRGTSARKARCRARTRTASRPRNCGWRRRVGRRSAARAVSTRAKNDDGRDAPRPRRTAATVSSPNQSLRGPSSSTYSSAPRKPAIDRSAPTSRNARTADSPACRSRSASAPRW